MSMSAPVSLPMIGDVIALPSSVAGVVFDMDGVLLDSFGGDHALCQETANAVLGRGDWITPARVAANFALDPEAFWTVLASDAPTPIRQSDMHALVAHYNRLRETAVFPILPGVTGFIDACRAAGLKCAVASSNDQHVVDAMLQRAGLFDRFDAIVGIADGRAAKPAPDLYLAAATRLQLAPQACAFLEDSLTGLKAGRAAGYGVAIGVATGPTTLAQLASSGLADRLCTDLQPSRLRFITNAPAQKTLQTPNDFVSHMVEHIAWRIGDGIDLTWRNDDWRGLGAAVGAAIAKAGFARDTAATLGMIDDGAAETLIELHQTPAVDFSTHPSLPRDAVLNARVEQLDRGGTLLELMQGLAEGLGASITVRMCTFEDPHHSWEGVFRALGISLARLRATA